MNKIISIEDYKGKPVEEYEEIFDKILSLSCDIEDFVDAESEEYQQKLMYIKGIIDCLLDVPQSKFNYYFTGTEDDIEEFLFG